MAVGNSVIWELGLGRERRLTGFPRPSFLVHGQRAVQPCGPSQADESVADSLFFQESCHVFILHDRPGFNFSASSLHRAHDRTSVPG